MHISLDRQITSGSWLNPPVKVSRAAKSNNPPLPQPRGTGSSLETASPALAQYEAHY